MDQGDRRHTLGCQAAGGEGVREGSDEGRMGWQPSRGEPFDRRQDECRAVVRRSSGGGLLVGGCGRRASEPEAATRGWGSPRFGCEAGRRPEGGRDGQTGAAAGKQALGWVGGTADDATGLEVSGERPRHRRRGGRRRSQAGGANEGVVCGLGLGSRATGEARQLGQRQPLSASLPNTTAVDQATALGGARKAVLSTRRSIGRWPVGRGRGRGSAGVCPSVQTDAPAANQKAAGAASCCPGVRLSSGWMKAGWLRPGVRLCPVGFTGDRVDNCLATLARLRPGRVMSIGTVEAGGRGSAFGLDGRACVGVVGGGTVIGF